MRRSLLMRWAPAISFLLGVVITPIAAAVSLALVTGSATGGLTPGARHVMSAMFVATCVGAVMAIGGLVGLVVQGIVYLARRGYRKGDETMPARTTADGS